MSNVALITRPVRCGSPHKRTQSRSEDIEVLLTTILRHPPRQNTAEGDQRCSVRADQYGLAGLLLLGCLVGGDFGVEVCD